MKIEQLIIGKDYESLKQALTVNPELANICIPYDEVNQLKAHPLHRICDRLFSKSLAEDEAVNIAKIFLAHGANVDGGPIPEKMDTPLIAAASLNADALAFLYIEHGANIHHAGTHGGTALHWAAWCGRDKLVQKLIQAGAEINRLCIDFKSTPLFWNIHGYINCGKINHPSYLECTRLFIQAGADTNIPNAEGYTVYDLLNLEDAAFFELLN